MSDFDIFVDYSAKKGNYPLNAQYNMTAILKLLVRTENNFINNKPHAHSLPSIRPHNGIYRPVL